MIKKKVSQAYFMAVNRLLTSTWENLKDIREQADFCDVLARRRPNDPNAQMDQLFMQLRLRRAKAEFAAVNEYDNTIELE